MSSNIFQASLRMYLNIFMCLHIVGLFVIYGLPRFIRGERSQQASNASVLKSSTASTNGTLVVNNNSAMMTMTMTTRPQLITKENDGAQSNGLAMTNGHHQKKITITTTTTTTTTVLNTKKAHNIEQFVDKIPINRNQCDINVNNTENRLETDNGIKDASVASSISGDGGSAKDAALTALASATMVASSSKNLNNVTNDDNTNNNSSSNGSDHHLSMKIRERIDSETRLIEDKLVSSFDKTVTGIVELKDDLMRVNHDEMYAAAGMKMVNDDAGNGGLRKRNLTDGKEIETFLRKEMNNANVKVVLGNSQAD